MKQKHCQPLTLSWSTASAFLLLAAISIGLNYSALSGNWRWDDPSILLHIHSNSFIDDFTTPETWQSFSPANLTPWLTFSYELDLILFGLEPKLFYFHQLIAITIAGFMLYCLLGLWVKKSFALLGASLFLFGTPGSLIAQQLMTRHYIEGLIFCLSSLFCFVLFLRQHRNSLLILSTVLYLLAVTAKEIYVPLVLLLPFLPEGNGKSRVFAAIPHLVIAAFYTVWRGYMLGSLGGGYVSASDYLSLSNSVNIAGTFSSVPKLFFGDMWMVAVFIYVFLFISAAIYSKRVIKSALIIIFLVFTPLVPLVSFPGIVVADRYLLLPWLVLALSVALFCNHLSERFLRNQSAGKVIWLSILVLFAATAWYSSTSVRESVMAVAHEYDGHSEFIWENPQHQFFHPTPSLLASYWYVTDLIEFKSRILEGASSPQPVVDYYLVDEIEVAPWAYEAECTCLRQQAVNLAMAVAEHRKTIDQTAALSLEFEYLDSYFSWNFGPYEDGQYHIVSEMLGLVSVPKAGNLRVNVDDGMPFYLRYTSPEGWTTYSDEQRVFSNSEKIQWERTAP